MNITKLKTPDGKILIRRFESCCFDNVGTPDSLIASIKEIGDRIASENNISTDDITLTIDYNEENGIYMEASFYSQETDAEFKQRCLNAEANNTIYNKYIKVKNQLVPVFEVEIPRGCDWNFIKRRNDIRDCIVKPSKTDENKFRVLIAL